MKTLYKAFGALSQMKKASSSSLRYKVRNKRTQNSLKIKSRL